MLSDPARLRRKMERLLEFKKARRLDGEGMEALAECCFRLALAPSTRVADQIDLLHQAFKCDGANPKYPYHLARLYFIHGELKQAASWLQLAHRLCPTSHRVWSHISLLQRELNAVYYGNDNYEPDALRLRSDDIAKAVRAGKDALDQDVIVFEPPPSRAAIERKLRQESGARSQREVSQEEKSNGGDSQPATEARRFVNANQCRWSGINDLAIEQIFEGAPSRRNLKQLSGLLREVASLVPRRRSGASAFALLAVEWIVSGYPVATVRGLRKEMSMESSPSLDLLDLVCDLYEADERDLPLLLSEALEEESVPPMLAALIHQRRLLWRPLEFRSLGVYRSARSFIASARREPPADEAAVKAQLERAAEYTRRLARALDSLNAEKPAPLEDLPAEEAETISADDLIESLWQKSQQTTVALDEAWPRLKALAKSYAEGSFGEEELAATTKIRECLDDALKQSADRLAEIAEVRASGKVAPEKLDLLDQAEKQFQTIGQRRGPFSKNLSRLPVVEKAAPPEDIIASSQKAVEAVEELTGVEALERAIKRVEGEVSRLFKEARATFDAYSFRAKLSPPVRAIRLSVLAREAETFYRLGKRREARRVWSEMLREDRLDVGALKNIAVCDTMESDATAALASWRSYAEALYFYSVAESKPVRRAGERADFHRALGNAYAPAFLFEKLDNNWIENIDQTAFDGFLASPGRVRNFVEHKLLEFLNAKLDFTSPPLILGVRRDANEQARDEARKQLLSFIDDVRSLLPDRVREAFADASRHYVEDALTACASSGRLLLKKDSRYKEEEDRQIHLLAEFCHLKFKLTLAAQKSKDFAKHMTGVDFFEQLARLDAIPLNQSPDFIKVIAGSLGISDPDELLECMKHLKDTVITSLLKFIFTESDDAADNSLRERQYRRLIDEWVKREALADYLDFIDDPHQFYPEAVLVAFQTQQITPEAIALLRQWTDRYPELTGPARRLAIALGHEEKYREVISVLDRACRQGFHKSCVTTCYFDRMFAWYSCGAAALEAKDKDEGKRCLRQALRDAEYVIANSKDEKELETARKRRDEIKPYV